MSPKLMILLEGTDLLAILSFPLRQTKPTSFDLPRKLHSVMFVRLVAPRRTLKTVLPPLHLTLDGAISMTFTMD